MSTVESSSRLSDLARQKRDSRVRGRFDAAQTTDDNRRHWGAADGLSAEAANSLPIRKILRNRSRYEVANNSYLSGIISTLANDTIGTGPRLQMLTGEDALDSTVEEEFADWAEEVDLAEKLRTLRRARCESGEVVVMFVTNPGLQHQVKLDLMLIEADQLTDPSWQSVSDPNWCDGVRFDVFGNPASYRILRYHPGSLTWGGAMLEYDDVPARLVYHYFRTDRPGQRRGVPEITPALSNWPELRRYCNAVIAAAETAADYAMTIESEAPADDGDASPEVMDTFELQKRMATVMPKGWRMSQTKAEQPTTSYGGFVDKKLAEAARCLNMPFTIAALDSSSANLSARYLDSQIYAKAIKIERHQLCRFLNRILDLWLTEASRISGLLSSIPAKFPHKWCWPSIGEHADPDKVASAQAQRLKIGTGNLADEIADAGDDWEDKQQLAARTLGLTLDEYRTRLADSLFPPSPEPAPTMPFGAHPAPGAPPAKQPPAADDQQPDA